CRPISLPLNTGFLSPYCLRQYGLWLRLFRSRSIRLRFRAFACGNTRFLSPYFAPAQYGLLIALLPAAIRALATAISLPLNTPTLFWGISLLHPIDKVSIPQA
ncbi:MAG: hypothetical protein KIG72_01035, partial [Bradymonadales bacterium]|nr:hypothetical protein [Bradymonadales bacterium]